MKCSKHEINYLESNAFAVVAYVFQKVDYPLCIIRSEPKKITGLAILDKPPCKVVVTTSLGHVKKQHSVFHQPKADNVPKYA